MSETPSYLNVGCGTRYHPGWINLDINPQGAGVIAADLSRGIPLSDNSCAVVYSAAVLEHLRRPDATKFTRECFRVLVAGGILRVGVPDLERLAHLYLEKLAAAESGDTSALDDYDWIMLELFDQTVRERPGGEMLRYLQRNPLPNESFVLDRIGDEGRQVLHDLRSTPAPGNYTPPSLLRRVKRRLDLLPSSAKKIFLDRLLDEHDREALAIGRFRLAGEVHQWMYDRHSLGRLLSDAGFANIRIHSAATSDIPGWQDFHLDILPDGQVTKPDLFFMEARKPESSSHG